MSSDILEALPVPRCAHQKVARGHAQNGAPSSPGAGDRHRGDRYDAPMIESSRSGIQVEPLDRERRETHLTLACAISDHLEIWHDVGPLGPVWTTVLDVNISDE